MPLPRPIPPALADLIAQRLRVLGQPMRIRLIERLDRGEETTVRALADELEITPYNASQQLGVLRQAELVARRQRGRQALYRLVDPTAIAVYEQVAAGLAAEAHLREQRMRGDA